MNFKIIDQINQTQIRHDLPLFRAGDKIKVVYRVSEGKKERLQNFEGVVIKLQGSVISRSVAVRKVTGHISVEKRFLLNSPRLEQIIVLQRGKTRRARLYYLRNRYGRAARIKTIQK